MEKEKCVSYAPSIATEFIPDNYKRMFTNNLKQFLALSIREESGADIIGKLLGKRPEVVLDPVFLLDKMDWIALMPKCPIKKPYIFCYYIGNVDGMRTFAKKMSKITGLPLVLVNHSIRDELYKNIKIYSAGPKEFLSLLYHASYVCTNSYHAVLFSCIFKKDFWVFVNEDGGISSQTRIYDIASRLGFEERILKKKQWPLPVDLKIEYHNIEKKIEIERKKSLAYINAILTISMEKPIKEA